MLQSAFTTYIFFYRRKFRGFEFNIDLYVALIHILLSFYSTKLLCHFLSVLSFKLTINRYYIEQDSESLNFE